MPTSGEPSPPESPDTPQHPGQQNFKTHEVPADPNPMLELPREPSSDEPHALPDSGNFNCYFLSPIFHDIHTAHADTHPTVPTLDVPPKESDFEVAARRIDEIAKVVQTVVSHSSSNHASVLGAHAQEFNVEGEKHHRTSEVVWRPPYSPNIV